MEWIANQFHNIITAHKEKLPSQSRKFKYPMILWCLIPGHEIYGHYNDFKDKFNRNVKNTTRLFREMSELDLTSWEYKNLDYFVDGKLSPLGLTSYWKVIDSVFESWDRSQMKNQIELSHVTPRFNKGIPENPSLQHKSSLQTNHHWHRERNFDKYHWRAADARFKLPEARHITT